MGEIRIEVEDPVLEGVCAGCGGVDRDRKAFGIEWRAEGMTLTDAPVRDRPDLLGAFVPRDAVLALPEAEREHLWHVVDHIVLDDARLASCACGSCDGGRSRAHGWSWALSDRPS